MIVLMRSKVISVLTIGAAVLLNPLAVFAADPREIGNLTNGLNSGISADTSLGTLVINALKIIYIIASLAVLFMLVFGAFQWITSGGDKEAVQKARSRITNALIGLAILALALFITVLVSSVLNINILNLDKIPTLQGN